MLGPMVVMEGESALTGPYTNYFSVSYAVIIEILFFVHEHIYIYISMYLIIYF